jgi:hypothetical protein
MIQVKIISVNGGRSFDNYEASILNQTYSIQKDQKLLTNDMIANQVSSPRY